MKPNDGWRPTRLEEALGPATGRFFGAGYRTVTQDLDGEWRRPDVFEGVGHVSYPEDWSVRDDGSRRTPHLSTIDAVALPLRAICGTWSRPPGEYVSAIDLRAGSQPWLSLDRVPVVVEPVASSHPAAGSRIFSASVGNIKARLGLTASRQSTADDRLCRPGEADIYQQFYRSTDCATILTNFDRSSGLMEAVHEFTRTEGNETAVGLECEFWPAVTVIDYLVTMGQIVQVLMAERQGTDRGGGQLWMRTMSIQLPSPPTPLPASITSRTSPAQERLLEREDRRIHLITTDSFTSTGVHVAAQLAYVEDR
ncbi:MAG: AvrD family protein [Brevibacterium aurantiacum]|uniref:AvrD family protein n=1 Tax=Brevibacterium aurantiacum TaxID=273384 RepID=UPI003F8DFD3E